VPADSCAAVDSSLVDVDAAADSVDSDTDCGTCAAALRVVADSLEDFCGCELDFLALEVAVVVEVAFADCPGNAWAAAAAMVPVAATLPAISQRLTRVSLRSATSLDPGVVVIGAVSSASIRLV
jgi:hypothetical protein